MKTICTVASDYLGLPEKECIIHFGNRIKSGNTCSYYWQKEDDPDHPSELPEVCGNCMHWIVVEA